MLKSFQRSDRRGTIAAFSGGRKTMKLDRRSFLLSSAVAAAKLNASAQEPQEIRAAFVGIGIRGSSLLSETL